jgi:hypothetical protein
MNNELFQGSNPEPILEQQAVLHPTQPTKASYNQHLIQSLCSTQYDQIIEAIRCLFMDAELFNRIKRDCVMPMLDHVRHASNLSSEAKQDEKQPFFFLTKDAHHVTSYLLRKTLLQLERDCVAGDFDPQHHTVWDYVFFRAMEKMSEPVLYNRKMLLESIYFRAPWLRWQDNVDDLLQECLLGFIEKVRRGLYDPFVSNVCTYISHLARGKSFVVFRATERMKRREFLFEQVLRHRSDAFFSATEQPLLEKERQVYWASIYNTMDASTKKMVELFANGCRYAEIASLCCPERTPDAVRMIIRRALDQIKPYISNHPL